VPRLRGRPHPRAAADVAEALDEDVENRGLRARSRAEIATRRRLDGLAVAIEDPIGVEDLHVQLAFELAERAEHAIDRAARLFAILVGCDDEEASFLQIAGAADRNPVRGPVVEKRVDRAKQRFTLSGRERGRNSENPDVGVIAELIDVYAHIATLNGGRRAANFIKMSLVSIAKILDMMTGRTSEPQPRYQHDPLRLATAAVLLDIAYADGEFHPAEDENLVTYLSEQFALSPDDTSELVEAADEIRKKTVDHFALTHYIRKNAPLSERIDIVKTMWRIVYSDGQLTGYESYLVRKLSDLLGLEHHVMIDAKSAVLDEIGRP